MGRGFAATLALLACAGTAAADSTRKVEVVTDPPGATIYLGDLDNGEACTPTPCSVNAPAGKKTAVIARKDGFGEEFGVIDLRHGGVKTVTLKLTATTATLICDDPGLAGGTILVDDVDKGKAPAHVPIETAGHHVVVMLKGRAIYDEFIKVDPAEEYTIKPNKSDPAPLPPKQTPIVAAVIDKPGDGDDTSATDNSSTKITKSATPSEPHEMWIAGGGMFQVGFRQFKYDNAKNLPPTEDEGGQVLIGPSVQIWPMRLIGWSHLRGLSLYAKVLFGANSRDVVQDPNNMPTGASTLWGNIEVDVKQRWEIGDSGAVEINGGYVRDQLEYNATTFQQLDEVPYADYRVMRLGVRGSLRVGSVEPYAQVEGRIPFSEGFLATRFATADVTGGGAAAGLAGVFGPVVAKVEASIVYYSWALTPLSTDPTSPSATGARDVIEGISLLLGLSY